MTRAVDYLRVSSARQVEKDLTEEGYSIPAQRDACVARVRAEGWTLVDEYVDAGESARSADRPQLQQMLARIERDRDVDVVVVHKVDRLARNLEDHVAIRAALRRAGCQLVSVTENLEETASDKLVEGIHALMAEFYSANLSSEIRKGMTQKAKMGGYPQRAPLGYLNVRETIGGRQVASITIDPDRAPLVTAAFDLYATGDWTLERLHDELHRRGLRNRGTRKRPPGPVSLNGLSVILGNRAYLGEVEWAGVRYPGQHDPLTSPATFDKVHQLLATRASRGTRERKHPHYLKGLLHCAVCGRRLSIQVSKKRQYTYFFCLGQKNGGPDVCREPYTPADTLEKQVADLYRRVQLPAPLIDQLTTDLDAEIAARTQRDTAERDHQTRRLGIIVEQRRKLLDAYYANAIDLTTMKTEQQRLDRDHRDATDRLDTVTAHLTEWRDILTTALTFAGNCGDAYRTAPERVRTLYNAALFTRVTVRDGRVHGWSHHQPFDTLLNGSRFEYGSCVDLQRLEPDESLKRVRRLVFAMRAVLHACRQRAHPCRA